MTIPDASFMSQMGALEAAYLIHDDPLLQSGFGGGRQRWIAERSPLVDAIDRDGDFLDVGCANGALAADVVAWAAGRGHRIVPHGVDIGPRLIALARRRHPDHADGFTAANAWTWRPRRRWTFVYGLVLAPDDLVSEWARRMYRWVEVGGRLILADYGSRSRGIAPLAVEDVLRACGYEVDGTASGGVPPVTRFAWTTRRP